MILMVASSSDAMAPPLIARLVAPPCVTDPLDPVISDSVLKRF